MDSPIAELLAAIQSEQDEAPVRAAAPRPPARETALPPRVVQQLPDQAGVSTPWGELFDAMENARASRDQRAEQVTPGRVVR